MDMLGAVVSLHDVHVCPRRNQSGRLTIGMFGTFAFALFKSYEPIKRIGNIYQLYQQALGTSKQVFRFSICPKKSSMLPARKCLPRFSQSVEFEDASFTYEDGQPLMLEHINLTSSGRSGGRYRGHRAARERPLW